MFRVWLDDELFCIPAMIAKPKKCEKAIQVFHTDADYLNKGK
jgi:hypothetical protein